MCLVALEVVELCKMAGCLPHELLERYTLDQLSYAVEFTRAAQKYRLTEARSDMAQLEDVEDFGVAQVKALLFRQLVMGGG